MEVVSKGLPKHQTPAGLALVYFESTEQRAHAIRELADKQLQGRALVVSLEGFIDADASGRPPAALNSD